MASDEYFYFFLHQHHTGREFDVTINLANGYTSYARFTLSEKGRYIEFSWKPTVHWGSTVVGYRGERMTKMPIVGIQIGYLCFRMRAFLAGDVRKLLGY